MKTLINIILALFALLLTIRLAIALCAFGLALYYGTQAVLH